MSKTASADVVIFGGGIAGLWLLNRLRSAGFSALLLESGALGGGQTSKSQGIIHGGMKYALTGSMTSEALAMSDMPDIWRSCLEGKGELDLSAVPILSDHQYLWSPQKFASKLTGFLAGAALSSKVEPIPKKNYPVIFQDPNFKGEVYALNEMVIDVPVLIRELAKANQDAVYQVEPFSEHELKFDDKGRLVSATVYFAGKSVEISAQHFVFTAGSGNEVIIKKLKSESLAMQRRPLHMVVVKLPFDFTLYAHCMGLGTRPRITITTHHTQSGKTVWYLGGQLAEDGVERSKEDQIATARKELSSLFPWLDFSGAEFAAFHIDRAEPKQRGMLKPETSFAKTIQNVTIAWPAKLALAPKLAREVMEMLEKENLTPRVSDTRELRIWPMPPVAIPVWEELFCKKEN
ncbi:MAG TPA: FAD-dependent oxidoreductase [Gammaproteobacteria bacterium]|jgi:glycerol-3-phosphate dehydrogenase|nr:FAD-dependent oxidoreductase [Gammaproteobacteria bacterium]